MMEHSIGTFTSNQLPPNDLKGMLRLRYEVFSERLGWEVQTSEGMERDGFDDLQRVAYVLAKSSIGTVG